MLHFEAGNLYEVCEIANPLILVDRESKSFRSINEKCLFMDSVSGKLKVTILCYGRRMSSHMLDALIQIH